MTANIAERLAVVQALIVGNGRLQGRRKNYEGRCATSLIVPSVFLLSVEEWQVGFVPFVLHVFLGNEMEGGGVDRVALSGG
jgi:hypothetical protein